MLIQSVSVMTCSRTQIYRLWCLLRPLVPERHCSEQHQFAEISSPLLPLIELSLVVERTLLIPHDERLSLASVRMILMQRYVWMVSKGSEPGSM